MAMCVWVCISIISKSSWPILMTFGRMVHNDKSNVRTHFSPIWNVKIAGFYIIIWQISQNFINYCVLTLKKTIFELYRNHTILASWNRSYKEFHLLLFRVMSHWTFFSNITYLLIIQYVKCNERKKTLDLKQGGGPGMCSVRTHQIMV